MENEQQENVAARYKLVSRICLIIGFAGLVNTLSSSVIRSDFGNLGLLAIAMFFLLKPVLGVSVAASISSIFAGILNFSCVVFLALGYFYNQKAKTVAEPIQTAKGLKLSKIILWVLAGIVGFGFVAGLLGGIIAHAAQ